MDDDKYFDAIVGDYLDSWSYTITKAWGCKKEESYGPELICEGDFNIPNQYEDYPYLEGGNQPFKILNTESDEYEDVYLEYDDYSYMNFCICKTKGLEEMGENETDIYENIKKFGKK